MVRSDRNLPIEQCEQTEEVATVVTMLLVLSGLCLLSAFVWRGAAHVTAPVGALAAVAASFLTVPPGPLVVPVTLATGLVAAFGLATAFGILHPPTPHHH